MLKIKWESHIHVYDFDSKTPWINGNYSPLLHNCLMSEWRKYWFSHLFSLKMKDLVPHYQEEGLKHETFTISLTTKQQAFCFKKVPFYSQNEHFKRISITRNIHLLWSGWKTNPQTSEAAVEQNCCQLCYYPFNLFMCFPWAEDKNENGKLCASVT